MPRVTVVMAVYNAAPFLREAVASVLTQTYRDFELITVDDASSDDSLAILQSFDDERIRIIRHERNMGAALSRNDALVAARGELIAIMDADDVSAPTRLEQQIAFLDAHLEVGLVGCAIYDNIDASGAVLCTSILPRDNEAIQQTLMERWCFLHSSIMFRKVLHESTGGYRTAFEPAEDHDFVLRIVEHAEAHNLHERLVSYRLNPKGLTVTGHQYVSELGAMARRLARRRRSGQPEDLEVEMPRVVELKHRRKPVQGFVGVVQVWRDSLFTASRYYELGCGELYAGHTETARRCFFEALRANAMAARSWIGLALSLIPIVVRHPGFVFRSSGAQDDDRGT